MGFIDESKLATKRWLCQPLGCFMRKSTYEIAKCKFCGKDFKRVANASRKAQSCPSKKCRNIAKICANPGKPVGFESIRNDPSPYRAMIDYHGRYMP